MAYKIKKISFGAGLKYFNGNYSNYIFNSFAVNFGVIYENYIYCNPENELKYKIGASIIDFGQKIKLSSGTMGIIPANLQIGNLWSYKEDFGNFIFSVNFAYQFSKLLVPTPPIYENGEITAGYDPTVNAFRGAIQSFYDAPNGFKEEIHEINQKAAIEFQVNLKKIFFAVRAGIFNESKFKGDRTIIYSGASFGTKMFSIDFSFGHQKIIYNSNYYGAGINFVLP
jgi:hypothetical protein